MIDVVEFLIEIIRLDIFIGFGLYSILYVLITLFKKGQLLEKIDQNATRFICFMGIIFGVLNIIWTILAVVTLPDYKINHREYWWVLWVQLILWVTITQLFRIRQIRKIKTLRIAFAFLLIVSFDMLIILVTTIHRDYLPVSWFIGPWSTFEGITSYGIIVALLTKVVLFCGLSELYAFIVSRFKTNTISSDQGDFRIN